ncbi:Ubiquitin carboxyl-terminal hydrolase 8 [Grifola frondosa]|uniref:ubiquitinyl hydrolase 1 n=1 Tax=Grifola frondosa TaxID=5627 RepID=A0A1C7MB43_GRIFR|nr:Ubiquitin carboxyl-terminal hydrolase 8 [Grifola frondosa]
MDFQQHEGRDLVGKTGIVEVKLMEVEKSMAQTVSLEDEPSSPILKSAGGSIADRMRSLQNAGLHVSTTKRFSREIPTATPPLSPDMSRPGHLSLQATSPFSAPLPLAGPSPHALVPTSSFGPPSPTSSTSSSPRASHMSLSDFAQTFPPIDELDEMHALKLPSVPTGTSSIGSRSSQPSIADLRAERSPKPFPALPMDLGPRPSSTPIPPTIDTFLSRPGSPAHIPHSPVVPRKPSGLSLNSPPAKSLIIGSTMPEKPELPKALYPRTLLEYDRKQNFKVLVLDVRTREQFEREHIKADAVVCIEPSVLQRESVTAQSIEDSLSVAPRNEATLFNNRDKFDLVAIYDDSSENFGDSQSALSCLVRAIFEMAFSKFLKRPPMLLEGGLHAWKQEFGEAELIRGGSTPHGAGRGIEGMVNGASSSGTNGLIAPVASYPEPRGPVIGHTRTPAESSSADIDTSSQNRSRSGTEPSVDGGGYKPWIPPQSSYGYRYSPGQAPSSPRLDTDIFGPLSPTLDSKRLSRKPAILRPASNSISYPQHPAIPENVAMQHVTPPMVNGSSPIQYPQIARHISPQVSGSSFSQSPSTNGLVSVPPQASINPSPLSRRRSDYIDQSQEALSGLSSRASIDYPELSSQHILRPHQLRHRRQWTTVHALCSRIYHMGCRMQVPATDHSVRLPCYILAGYPDWYFWTQEPGNTCYMNSTVQCLSATVPFARFFTDGRWKSAVNMVNPYGTKGNLAQAFANIIRDMWQGELQCLSPTTFRRSLCMHAPQFSGTEQHDSQEFLSFLLDGLHEDLNRVLQKPKIDSTPEREAELEKMPVQIASEQEWQIYRMRDDSLVVDFFQGQFRNRLECLTCHKTSTTYNAFMYLTLPIPTGRRLSKVSLQHCLDTFFKEEVMEKSDAWHCPHCKTLRKATKHMSLSRLPPVLLIHLKRFSAKGPFTDKIETFVDFPLKSLDLTNYMPPPLPPGVSGGTQSSPDDPRSQLPPYRYDLYGVTNHFGTLSTGHYTAFIASRGGWLYCDDSHIKQADPKDVVGKPAYVLFYKRTRS